MRRGFGGRLGAGLALLALLAPGALGHGGEEDPPRRVPENAYALVGDVAILKTAVDAEASRGFPAVVALQRLIAMEVLRQNLVARGVDPAAVTEAELDRGVAEAKASLAAQGAGPDQVAQLDQFRDAMRVPVAFSGYVASQVRDDDLVKDFERWRMELAGELRVRAIVFVIDPAKGGVDGARARLDAVRARLGDAPTDEQFAAAARTESDDPNAVLTGGDLDWQSPRAPTVSLSLVEACMRRGAPGLVAEPVATPRALYLLYVSAVRIPTTATLDALLPRMREEARAWLASQLMDEWLKTTPIVLSPDAPHYQQRR